MRANRLPRDQRNLLPSAARSAIGLVACSSLALAYAAAAWHIVFTARIGRVVATIDESAGRGLHAGDILAIPLLLLAGLCAFLAVASYGRWTAVRTASTRYAPPHGAAIHVASVLPAAA